MTTEITQADAPLDVLVARRLIGAVELVRKAAKADDWERMSEAAFTARALLPESGAAVLRQHLQTLSSPSHPYCPCGCMEPKRKELHVAADAALGAANAALERAERALYRPRGAASEA